MTKKRFPFLPLLLLLLSGAPAASFSQQTGEVPQDIVVADFNRDGRKDLAIVHAFSDNIVILLQNSEGGFDPSQELGAGNTAFFPYNAPRAVKAFDFDRNEAPGLIVLSSGNFAIGVAPSIRVYKNRGDGVLSGLEPVTLSEGSPAEEQFPVHFVVGDFGGPVGEDLAVAMLRGRSVLILHGDGTGGFSPADTYPLEVNGEGPEYLLPFREEDGVSLVAATSGGLAFLPAVAPGEFDPAVQIPLPNGDGEPRAALLADYNGDGNLDLVVADATNRVWVLRNFQTSAPWYNQHIELTDPSLATPNHLAPFTTDSKGRAGLAVANIGSDSVTVFSANCETDIHPTGLAPRRLAIADLTGNGMIDLVTANQGDLSIPSNPDYSVLYRIPPTETETPSPDSSLPLGTALGARLARASGLASTNPSTVWTLECNGTAIQSFNPSTTLNSNPNARFGQRVEFPFIVGGFTFVGGNTGWVVERDAPRLHRFTLAQGQIQQTVTMSVSPGELGFRGLEKLGTTGDFFLTDPSNQRVIRVSTSGNLVTSATTPHIVHDIAYDSGNNRIHLSHPGVGSLLAYNLNLEPQPSANVSLEGHPLRYLRENGIAGITVRPNQPGFFVLDQNRMVLRTSPTLQPEAIVTITPASRSLGVVSIPEMNRLWILGADYHLAGARKSDLSNGQLASLWPIVGADPEFIPGGLAWDGETERLIVSDRDRPVVAFLDDTGDLDEIVVLDNGHGGELNGSVAVDSMYRRLFLRTKTGALSYPLDGAKSSGTFLPLPTSGTLPAFAAAGGYLLTSTHDPSINLVTTWFGPEASTLIHLPPTGTGPQGIGLLSDGTLVHFQDVNGGNLATYSITFPEETRVGDWAELHDIH